MAVTVKRLCADSAAAWDSYVAGHPDGTFCHRAGWKQATEQGAGHECPYLYAEADGAIVGILPLTVRRSRLFGPAVISNMFCVYGGPLTSMPEALTAMDAAALEIMANAGCGVLEYRTPKALHAGQSGWQTEEAKSATFSRMLEGTTDDELLTAIPRKQRAVVRKSLQKGLITDWTQDLDDFYALYALSVKNLGTPVFPRKLFEGLQAAFGDDMLVQITRTETGEPVASLISFLADDAVLPYYAGGGPTARHYHAHEFMYYELMKKAVSLGKSRFDFGRSKIGSGPYNFKKNWGFTPHPLEYEYWLQEGCDLPDTSPQNPKYRALITIWKRLPLWLANRLGPPIARHLG